VDFTLKLYFAAFHYAYINIWVYSMEEKMNADTPINHRRLIIEHIAQEIYNIPTDEGDEYSKGIEFDSGG
jgi:hypothetical protein